MKKIITVLLITTLIFISGCSEKPLATMSSDPIEIDMAEEFNPYSVFDNIQEGSEVSYELDKENSKIKLIVRKDDKEEVYENIDVTLIYPQLNQELLNAPYKAKALKDIEIYDGHSSDANLAGYVREGDCFEVHETYTNDDDVWCRISSKHWINNMELSLLEVIENDTEIDFIKNVITFTDESLSMDRLSPWYDRYYQHVPCSIESMCNHGACELDEKGRIYKWTSNNNEGLDYISFVEYIYDDNDRRIHVSSNNVNGQHGSWDYTYDDQSRIITEVYNDGFDNSKYNNEYDLNGNLIRIFSNNTNIEVEYEYNGSLRFETIPYSSVQGVFHIYRFDSNGNEIERFTAPDGDIRNSMPLMY